MASELGGGDDTNGSLFEGMVLFTPSNLSQTPDPSPLPPRPAVPPPPPPPPSHTQPLDEDLFSDLTLQIAETLSPDPPPLAPAPAPADPPPLALAPAPADPHPLPPPPSRQISRKKKRAVRIGYARDDATAAAPDDPPSPPPRPLPSSSGEPAVIATTPSPAELPPPTPLEIDSYPHHAIPELPDQSRGESDDKSSDSILEEEENQGKDLRSVEEEIVPSEDWASTKDDAFGSIEEKLELVRARISKKLDLLGKKVASVAVERKELVRRRRKAAESVNFASERYKELEKELEEACEAEDFEWAERVSESLAAVEKEKDELLIRLREVEMECDSVESKMQEMLESQIGAEEEGAGLLEQFAKDAVDSAALVLKSAEDTSSKKLEEWKSLMESLEIKKLEMEIQSCLISEARLGLAHGIDSLVEDDKKEKEMLKRKGGILAKELDELLTLVRLKEAEIAENNSQIQEVESRISNVVSEFHETQSSIDSKHDNLQAALLKVESESEALLVKKKEIDEFIYLAEQKRLKLIELASVSADEAKTCLDLVGLRKSLASSFLKSREDKVRLAKTEVKILEDIQMLKQQISGSRTTLQELSSSRASIEEEIVSFKQRIGFIDKRGPELEAEKKVAAAARNFKEAGRIAAEAKALNIEKEDLQNKREKAVLELEKLEKEIKGILDKIQECEMQISQKEKEAATTSFKRLQLIAAAARAERAEALEMGDDEEGDILLKEAESAECKTRELQEAYGLEPDGNEKTSDHFVSIASIINLAGQHLAEMASSLKLPVASG
ncbi:FK506-binding protein 5-like [Phoenix dactylifera]|uniref:FK506-binding protein 5-like n=1 Tax=Phoenix dactylifera TaxID=42345 RepID=A0A8B7MUW6_PHODC|nr:FK506-binding protein 5-like [Phoenix dactylifera]